MKLLRPLLFFIAATVFGTGAALADTAAAIPAQGQDQLAAATAAGQALQTDATATAAAAATDSGIVAAETAQAEQALAEQAALVSANEAETAEILENVSTQSDPLMIIITFGIGAYLFYLWLQDYRARRSGNPNPNAFPGAFPASAPIIIIAIVGALVILAAETAGEIALGISAEQSTMTVLMLLAITAAAFFEELIFRGYLVVTKRGRAMLIGSILFFSVVFAIAHPFLWEITTPEGVPGWQFWNADWTLNLSTKGWFSTGIVLVNSLWFYAMRFNPLNPDRSLIPCMVAHLATNWGVFAVKLAQGHVSGIW